MVWRSLFFSFDWNVNKIGSVYKIMSIFGCTILFSAGIQWVLNI